MLAPVASAASTAARIAAFTLSGSVGPCGHDAGQVREQNLPKMRRPARCRIAYRAFFADFPGVVRLLSGIVANRTKSRRIAKRPGILRGFSVSVQLRDSRRVAAPNTPILACTILANQAAYGSGSRIVVSPVRRKVHVDPNISHRRCQGKAAQGQLAQRRRPGSTVPPIVCCTPKACGKKPHL